GGSWTLTPLQLAGLTLTSDGETQHFHLSVTATTTDGASTAPTAGSIHVDVTPVADAPSLDLDSGTVGDQHSSTHAGNEDTAIALDVSAALSEVDADATLSITITGVPAGPIPSAATFQAGGSWTLTPLQLA